MVYFGAPSCSQRNKSRTELTIAVEGAIPEKYRPHVNCIFFPVVTDSGRILACICRIHRKNNIHSAGNINVGAGTSYMYFHRENRLFQFVQRLFNQNTVPDSIDTISIIAMVYPICMAPV